MPDFDLGWQALLTVLTGKLTDAQIAPAAGIEVNKLAAVATSKLLVSDSSGFIAASSVTSTEAGYLSGVTSSIQTQLNSKISTVLPSAEILVGNGSNVATAVAMSGDIGIDNTGNTQIQAGVIINADVNASAAIAYSKLASLTSGNILVGSAGNVATSVAMSGNVTISNTGVTTIGAGQVTSAMLAGSISVGKISLTDGHVIVGNAGTATDVALSGDATVTNAGVLTISNGAITDAKTSTYTTTKISVLSKSLLNSAIVYTDQSNTFGAFDQIFPDGNFKIVDNIDATKILQFQVSGVTTGTTRTLTVPDANDTIAVLAAAQTLTTKTINATNNTITDTSIATGDILHSTGTKFVRLAMGTANQILAVNSGGTDIAWVNNPGQPHPLLDGSDNNDTVSTTVSRGMLIVGNSTPLWGGLVIGASGKVLHSNGVDATWQNLVEADLPATTVFTDVANTFGAFDQKFQDTHLKIVASADATKVVTFLFSGMTTGQTLTISSSQSTSQTLTIPNITASDILMTYGVAGTVTAAKTFNNQTLLLENPAGTFAYTINSGAIVAARQLNLPVITGTDTLMVLGLAQTVTAALTVNSLILGGQMNLAGNTILNTGTLTLPTSTDTLVGRATTDRLTNKDLADSTTTISNVSATSKALAFSLSTMTAAVVLTIASSQSTSETLTIPNITGADTIGTLGLAQTYTGTKTFNALVLGGQMNIAGNTFLNTGVLTFPTTTTTIAGLAVAQTFTQQNTFAQGTITSSAPLTLTQSWNTNGGTFTGFLVNITESQSPSVTSLLADFQRGGTSQFNIGRSGNITALGTLALGTTNVATITAASLTSSRTITLPDTTTTLAGLSTAETWLAVQTFTTTLLKAADIVDSNSNKALAFTATAGAVDYFTMTSSATGTHSISLCATGSDTNVTMVLYGKGSGLVSIADGLDQTKIMNFNISGFTTGTTSTLAWSSSAGRTLTLPDATDTLVGKATTDILTNKNVNATNNTITDTSTATGDLLKSNGTKFVRFAMGSANQFLTVNSGGTDLTWISASGITGSNADNSFDIYNVTDNTKLLEFSIAGNTTGKILTIATNSSSSQTLNIPNITATDTFAVLGLGQTYTGLNVLNKIDSGSFIVDHSDNTKKIGFSLSGITTATTLTIASSQSTAQTLTIPNITGSDTLATLGLAQTFSGLNIHSLIDSGSFVVDHSDNTKKIGFSLSGMTTGKTLTLSSAQSNSFTLTIPNITANDTIATLGLVQTFTGNIVFTPATVTTIGTSQATQFTTPTTITGTAGLTAAVARFGINNLTFTTSPASGNVNIVRFDGPQIIGSGVSNTITNAATINIGGAPLAGSGTTITNAYSLWILGGAARFDAQLILTPLADPAAAQGQFWLSSTNADVLKFSNASTIFNVVTNKSARSTGQTAAVASVATLTVGGQDGSFEVGANINLTASTTNSITCTVTYTDENNTSRTSTFSFVQNGVPNPIQTITNVTGVGAYAGVPLIIRCKTGTTITIATTGTFTSVTYNVEGHIKRLA